MSHADTIIARIPTMTPRDLFDNLRRAEALLLRKPGEPEALRVRSAILAAYGAMPPAPGLIMTGRLAWEPHSPDMPRFRAFDGTRNVGHITKHATHTDTHKGVYSVTILGQVSHQGIAEVDEARRLGEATYASLAP